MDFSRQCRRFLNHYKLTDEAKKKFSNISAIGVLKSTPKSSQITTVKLVIADNDERSITILNEADGQILKEVKNLKMVTYSLCCTSKPNDNHIYVSDYQNNIIRKFDENLKELGQISINKPGVLGLNGPCGIDINNVLKEIHVVDQNNCRLVVFDLKTEQYVSDISLLEDELGKAVRFFKVNQTDLSVKVDSSTQVDNLKTRMYLDSKPFGLFTKNDRSYITDWEKGQVLIYKNGKLERKFGNKKSLTNPRNIIVDSLGFILIADVERNMLMFFDNKGNILFETKTPMILEKNKKKSNEKGVYGLTTLDNNKLIYATNSNVYVCQLIN